MKTFFRLALFFLTVNLFFFMGCGRQQEKKYRIGVSQCSGDYWRVKTNEEIKRELLLHEDVEVEIRSAESDNDRQIEDIRYFMDNGFDLIIVSPNETDELTPIVKEAYGKGIPVVTFDRRINGDSFTAHMEVDNYELGKSVARYARSVQRGPMNIIEIQGPTSASPAIRRHEGFTDALRDYPDSKVLASVCGKWDDGLSERLTDSLLDIYPETNVLYAHTDHMAIGASRAIKKRNRDDIAILGIDGFPHIGIKAVKDSMMTATFLYPSEGGRLLRIAMSILDKQPYERMNSVPPLSAIDRSNADILLSQDTLIDKETEKINVLRGKMADFLDRYNTQKIILYAAVIILLLLAVILFMLLKAINVNRRHQQDLMRKNAQLEDEKRKQQDLYDRLREVTQSKLMFFTNVSHDLRTPLTLISGPVEQVGSADYLTPRDKSMMKIAWKNVNILRRLIDQILDFRKYENGKLVLNLSETDLAGCIKEWTDSFRELARKRDIRLSVAIHDEACGKLAVDLEKIERVFFNLMSNAFKHTPDNGKISVTYAGNSENVSISVKDNGSGIAKEEQAKIFERFYQVKGDVAKGSGIGLALSKAFIELHGGSVSVNSDKGKGCEFTVVIPVRHCAGNDEAVAPRMISSSEIVSELSPLDKDEKEFDSEKPLMLVIDDNKDIQKLIEDLLGENYNMIFAPDGKQGVRMAVRYVPDIIICDVMMPVMDGFECVRRIKNEITTSHIPVLMLTACSMDEQRAQGYESGADGYISKPFSGEVLAARCHNLILNRKRIMDLTHPTVGKIKEESKKEKAVASSACAPNDVENDFYKRFVEIVEERLSNPDLSIETIAGIIGLSQSQLTRKIKALTNYTPVEIIRTLRLQKAKTLLFGTDRTISEIAFEVGFTSLAYFSKCYRQHFGEPPSDVRARK